MNDSFFFSAPQLKRDPLGTHGAVSLSDLCFAPAVLGILLGWYFGWKAHANVSDIGQPNGSRLSCGALKKE